MLHYLPGCDVRKNHREAIEKIIDYMKKQGAYIDICCRTNQKFLNEGDIIVQNCTLCELLMKETHPKNECLSLYEYVLNDEHFPWKNHHGEKITIQDCLRVKNNRSLQVAIRKCLEKMNYMIVEMDANYDQTTFDGVWIYSLPMQNCIDTAPKTMQNLIDNYIEIIDEDEKKRRMQDWVKKYETQQVLVYCNGCENGLKIGGIKPIHLVELIAEGL